MRCFYHRDADAIGMCKACNTALLYVSRQGLWGRSHWEGFLPWV
jgi:hypothetical protein